MVMKSAAGAGSNVDDRLLRSARRGSTMLTKLTNATVASIRMQGMADRSAKSAEEKRRRAEFAIMASSSEKWVWVVDDKEGYLPAKVLEEKPDGSLQVELGATRVLKAVKKSEIGPVIARLAEVKNHVDDMVRMGDVNEATILHNLKMRFMEDLIYTNIGSILVSINPFKFFPHLYTQDLIVEHLECPVGEIAPPHVFQIAASAFHGLKNERQNQSIVISGESGAGKTEATKKCLQFFASAAGSAAEGMENKLLSANPILEAFGNAKTVRNNNSSRFGKWMEVRFNHRAQISGCRINNYLLEKSRVVFQAPDERNYHIFYMLASSASPELRAKFALAGPEAYSYTNSSGCIVVDNMSDGELFDELMDAFHEVGFSAQEVEDLFQMVAALLHLSNVHFKPTAADRDKCELDPSSRSALENAARLLGAEPEVLKKGLEQRLLVARGEITWSPMSAEKAIDARNSMAKAVYGRMFDYLVQRVNQSMVGSVDGSTNIIGVLDIFGFEIFENNSFEQLCINFCNEKLQQHFNLHVFKEEEKCYRDEGIKYDEVRFVDNQDVLDVIELRPSGLLPVLDDECRRPGGSDVAFVEKICKTYADNPRFKNRPNIRGLKAPEGRSLQPELMFGINHYAGLVIYNAQAFMEKNKDELLLSVRETLQASAVPFMKKLFESDIARAASSGISGGGAKDKLSQSFQFRDELSKLMDTLNRTKPHYIRCIKPNNAKLPGVFDATICLQQLRYAGVFEAVKIRQLGFPFRWRYDLFYKRYRCCASKKSFRNKIPPTMDWKDGVSKLVADIAAVYPPIDALQFGRTMVLYRADPHRILESMRDNVRETSSLIIQRVYRGHKARSLARVLRKCRTLIRAAIKARDLLQVTAAALEADKLPFPLFDVRELKALQKVLLEEKACKDTLLALLPIDPADRYAEYDAALKEAARLNLQDPLVTRMQIKFDTVRERIECKADLDRGIVMGDKRLILAAFAKAEELRKDWGPILAPEKVARAQEVLEVIAHEEAALISLRGAVIQGRLTGEVGHIRVAGVDHANLERVIQECLGSSVRISTQVGHNLIQTAQRLRDVRRAFVSGEWSSIENAVAAVSAMRQEGILAPEVTDEVLLVEAEVAERRILRVVSSALSRGAATGRVGEMNIASIDVEGIISAIETATNQLQAVGSLSVNANTLINAAKVILRLRQSLVMQDWNAVRRAIQEAGETKMPEVCAAEIQAAKDEADNHAIIHQLTDALERGFATGTVAKLDVSRIDVTHLLDRVNHAEEIGAKTAKATGLIRLAKLVRRVRIALQTGDFPSIPDICKQALAIPEQFIPAITRDELLVAQYEAENFYLVNALRDAISAGNASGIVGAVSKTSVQTPPLTAALKKAQTLKCRSDESIWLSELAQALLELRIKFRDARWTELQNAIFEVRTFDNARASHSVSLEDAPPVLKEPSKLGRVASMRLSTVGLGDIARSRATSQEARGRPASVDMRDNKAAVAGVGVADSEPDIQNAFRLPVAVLSELHLLQDELDNHFLVDDLMKALSSGVATGPIGELDPSTVSVANLDAVLKKHERLTPKTPLAASLLYTTRVIRDLRLALQRDDWENVQSFLDQIASNNARVVRFAAQMDPKLLSLKATLAVPVSALGSIDVPAASGDASILEIAAITPSGPGLAELVRIEKESEYRRVIRQMAAALVGGGPSWNGASLDLSAVTVDELAKAIDASHAVNAKTEKSKHLTTLCRLAWQTRTAALEDDWASVESLLHASGEPLGKTTPLHPTCSVPNQLIKELDMYRLEANNRKILHSLATALSIGGPKGEVGHLDIGALEVRPIEDSIRQAMHLRCEKDEARCLMATAAHIRSMRLALMGGQWDRLGELLDYAYAASQSTRHMPVSKAYASLVAPDGSLASSKFMLLVQANSSDGQGKAATWPAFVDDAAILDVKAHGVCGIIAGEYNIMQLELNNRNIVLHLTNALSKGAATGNVGHLELSTIDTGHLDWAIDYAQRLQCTTDEARQLLLTAQLVKRIRVALLAGDWAKLESTLADAQGKVVADVGAAEILAAQDEVNNRAILAELAAALARGRPQGRTGRLFVGSIDVKPLNEAISLATKLTPKTTEARQMLFTAKVVARLRLCLTNEDLNEASMTLEAVRGKLLASVAIPEVKLVQDEVDNWQIISDLSAALSTGNASGSLGNLQLSTVEIQTLEKAIAQAEDLGVKTTEASSLLVAGKTILRLRRALLDDNWDPEDANSVDGVLRSPEMATLDALAKAEVETIRQESNNRKIVMLLSQALASSGPRGPVGELDLTAVQTAALDSAIAEATELGTHTEAAANLLASAKLIRRLRAVLLASNWQWVGSVLLEARNVKEIFPQVALKELQLAQDELDNRAIIAQLSSALRLGGIAGPVGLVDATQIDTDVLDEALTYAKTLGVKSAEATQMVATAQIVRKLRSLFRGANFEEAHDVLESIKGKILAAVAADEVQLARMNTDNWLVITKMTAALSSGSNEAVLGDVDPKSIVVEGLDVSIALAMRLGCHTVEARRCLITGLIIRRLRAALLDNDHQFLAQVLAEADKEGEAILSVARRELQAARDLVAFREIIHALQKAIEAQDEAALVDALARAARLSLAEHPHEQVRQQVGAATLALGRIQRCKAALAAGIKSLEVPMLLESLAMASSIGYVHPLVDEARRVLATVQAIIDRLTAAVRGMDALEMQAALRDADTVGLSIPVVAEARAVLALSRGEFLRKELSCILALAASGSTPAAMHVPLADGARAPTSIELRVVHCTLQLKDMFFADKPEASEAALLGHFMQDGVALNDVSSFLSHPAASSAVSVAQAQMHTEENVRGATQRNMQPPTLGGYAWALAGDNRGKPFKPGGTGVPAVPFVGGMVPPNTSALRKQFELSKTPNIKPPHMFSRKFSIAETADANLLRWQHEPIHTSLCLLQDAEHRRLAVKCFRDILAFMGDRPLANPLRLACDVLQAGASTPEIRDEIFVQLCKQLVGNPSAASVERGWVLLHLALSTFAPSEAFENHLELFLRERGALACVWALHLTLYRGGAGLAGIVSESDVQNCLDWAHAPALPALSFEVDATSLEDLSPSKSPTKAPVTSFPIKTAITPATRTPHDRAAADQQRLVSAIENRLASMQSALAALTP